jgi:hypothetical protein
MARLLLVLLVASFVAVQAQAQITITRADIEAGFDRVEITRVYDPQSEVPELAVMPDTTGLMEIARATGPDQTWDFTTLVSSFAFVNRRDAAFIPNDPDPVDFPGIDHPHFLETGTNVVRRIGTRRDLDESPDSVTVFYGRVGDSGLYLTGSVIGDIDTNGDASPDTIVSRFYNGGDGPSGALETPFPVTFGDTFMRMRIDSSAIPLPNPPGGVFEQQNLTETVTTTVEGWGTLVTPNGSFPALRARIVQDTDIFPPGPSPGDLSLRIYSFVTAGSEAVELMWIDEFLDDDPDAVVDGFGWFQIDPATVASEPGARPGATRLAASYPNPFRTATTVPFELAEAGTVRLTVYDVLGREVARLADGFRAAGPHELRFEAAGLPNGLYLLRLDADGTTATRKVILQR